MSASRLPEQIARLRQALERSASVCVLTGAGVSAESGVPVYRGNEGLYSAFSSADMATAEGFQRDPAKVWAWYHDRRRQLLATGPSAGHQALAQIEQRLTARGASFTLITQNVDGLHQAAGSRRVLEVHGNMHQARCTACGQVADLSPDDLQGVPACTHCGHIRRPHIVWFGEMLPHEVWQTALAAAADCELFLSVGTSATVQPVASLVHVAGDNGATVVEINLEPTPNSRHVDLSLLGRSGEILPQLL